MAAVSATRQPTGGTSFALRDAWPWSTFASLVVEGEELGYRGVFLPEIVGRDAFAALSGLAGVTSRLSLGTGVVPMTARAPALTAMGAATVQERSGGRAILGLGTGRPRPGALGELESQVRTIREMLDRAVRGESDHSTLALGERVPIWIAALGPRAISLAGRTADGVLLNWCSPGRVAEAKAAIVDAASSAGRDPRSVIVAAYIRAAADGHGARRALAAAAAEYASYPAYRRQFESMGVGAAAAALSSARASDEDVPPDVAAPLVDAVCLPGDTGSARARLQVYRDAGCDLPVVYPVPHGADGAASVANTLRLCAPDA